MENITVKQLYCGLAMQALMQNPAYQLDDGTPDHVTITETAESMANEMLYVLNEAKK